MPPDTRAPHYDALKLVAFAAMTADHLGAVVFDREYPWLTVVGRLAMPLFAFLLAAHGVLHTRRPRRYLARLLVFALLSQPAYVLAVAPPHFKLNIFFTLAAGLVAARAMRGPEHALAIGGAIWVGGLAERTLLGSSPLDFGLLGVSLVVAFAAWVRWRGPATTAGVVAVVATLNWSPVSAEYDPGHLALSVGAALAALLLIAWSRRWSANLGWTRGPVARWGFYLYYPAHLLVLHGVWSAGWVGSLAP